MKFLSGFAIFIFFAAGPGVWRTLAAQDAPALTEIAFLAEEDPEAALPAIDAALAQLRAQPAPDPQILFDLVHLKASLLAGLGRAGPAAGLYAELADFAIRSPGLGEDPVQLLARAAALFEEAGNLRAARAQLQRRAGEQADRNDPPEALARSYAELARLSDALGDADSAGRFRRQALAVPDAGAPGATRGAQEGFVEVELYYATDRARTGDPDPVGYYGAGRGELELGVATVTIPNTHVAGAMESPSIWRLEFAASPSRHVVLRSVTPVPADDFYARMQGEFADGAKSEAFVFIHGYNTEFHQAAKRAAQLAFDMNYAGVPILYSWPSRGSTIGYVADTAVVRLSGRRLAGFLEDLRTRSGATTINIVAHSMGNRALTDALEIMALQRGMTRDDPPLFGQVLFAAPDVDAGLFARMVGTFRPIARRLTLYASENDWALVSSRKLHAGAPRAGQGGADTLADDNIDSIDMSELGDDMLAHTYFADDSSALADMVALFWQNAPPDRRCGLVQHSPGADAPPIWRYQRGRCATQSLIDVIGHMRQARVATFEDARAVLARTTDDIALRHELEPFLEKLMAPQAIAGSYQ